MPSAYAVAILVMYRTGDNDMADINSAIRSFNRAGFNCTSNSEGVTYVDSREGDKHFTLVEYGNKESGTYDIGITGMKGITMSQVLDALPEDWSRYQ